MNAFQIKRRAWLGAAVSTGLGLTGSWANAQSSYPNRTVELIVPYPPGASTDLVARIIQPSLTASLNQQPFVIDNKGGAAGNIGAAYVAKSAPDGYRLLVATNAITTILPHLTKNPPFDALKDLVPVAKLASGPIGIAVRSDMPVKNLADLIALAKRAPGKLSYGTPGSGSPHHLIGEQIKQLAGVFIVHVPYRGIGPALTDLQGGTIDIVVSTLAGLTPLVSAGKLKVLAIAEGKRFDDAPNVPTVAETFPGFEASAWLALYAPAGTPADVIRRLNEAVNTALTTNDVRARFLASALLPTPGTPEALGALTRTDFARWGQLIRDRNIGGD